MSEDYSHWHSDMPIRRADDDVEDYDLDGYSAADAARDDLRDAIARSDDLNA